MPEVLFKQPNEDMGGRCAYFHISPAEAKERLNKAIELGLQQTDQSYHDAYYKQGELVDECFCGWGAIFETCRREQPDRFEWSMNGAGGTMLYKDQSGQLYELMTAEDTLDMRNELITWNDEDGEDFKGMVDLIECFYED